MRVGAALNLTPFAQSFVSLGGESPKLFGANASQSDSTKLPSRELAREEQSGIEWNGVWAFGEGRPSGMRTRI